MLPDHSFSVHGRLCPCILLELMRPFLSDKAIYSPTRTLISMSHTTRLWEADGDEVRASISTPSNGSTLTGTWRLRQQNIIYHIRKNNKKWHRPVCLHVVDHKTMLTFPNTIHPWLIVFHGTERQVLSGTKLGRWCLLHHFHHSGGLSSFLWLQVL